MACSTAIQTAFGPATLPYGAVTVPTVCQLEFLLEGEALAQFVHLRGHGPRIGGVAGKHFDGDGAPLEVSGRQVI